MRRSFSIIAIALLGLCLPSAALALTPDALSLPEHARIRNFVQWMRAYAYTENVISKWVSDYMDEHFTLYMGQEIYQHHVLPSNLVNPVQITFIELIPTDEGAEVDVDPAAPELVKAIFKEVFGIDAQVEYQSYPISYIDAFGPYMVENGQAYFDGYTMTKWSSQFFHDHSMTNPLKYIVRYAIHSIDGIDMNPYKLPRACSNLPEVGNDEPSLENPQVYAHEWSHAFGMGHHGSPYGMGPNNKYGTHSPLGGICSCAPCAEYQSFRQMVDPLSAYVISSWVQWDYPARVSGKAYSDYLASLHPCEVPYVADPNPSISVAHAFRRVSGGTLLQLDIQASNDGNIPVALVPVKTTVTLQCKSTGPRPVIVAAQEKVWNWSPVGEGMQQTLQFPPAKVGDGCIYTAVSSIPLKGIPRPSFMTKYPMR